MDYKGVDQTVASFKTSFRNITIINDYVLKNYKEIHMKGQFYKQLQGLYDRYKISIEQVLLHWQGDIKYKNRH